MKDNSIYLPALNSIHPWNLENSVVVGQARNRPVGNFFQAWKILVLLSVQIGSASEKWEAMELGILGMPVTVEGVYACQ